MKWRLEKALCRIRLRAKTASAKAAARRALFKDRVERSRLFLALEQEKCGRSLPAKIAITSACVLFLSASLGLAANHFIESFENPGSWSGYTTGTVGFDSGNWDFLSVYPESSSASYDGSKACRINDDVSGASITAPSVDSVGTVSFYYHRPFSGTGSFQLQKSVGGGAYTTLDTVDYSSITTPTYYSYDVNDAGNNIRIRVVNDDNTAHLTIDYFIITDYAGAGPDDPTGLTITTNSTTRLDLSWTDNAAGDDVLLAYLTSGSFGTPSDGTSYSAGNSIGDATVLQNSGTDAYNHTSLIAGQAYSYKIWSVDGSDNYSAGIEGAGAAPCFGAPTATAATNAGSDSFYANWNAVSGATGYILDVATNTSFSSGGGGVLLTVDFETADDGYTASGTHGSGVTDVFNRDNTALSGSDGYFWAIEDTTLSNPYLTLDSIDITGVSAVDFSIDFLTRNSDDWDSTDSFIVKYSVDGGAFQTMYAVEHDPDDAYNEPARIDVNHDGDGDGDYLPAITDAHGQGVGSSFATFGTNGISVSGTGLVLRLEYYGLDATDEALYIDNVTVSNATGGGGAGSKVPGFDDLYIGDVNTLAVIGLTAGTHYYYRLKATNDNCESDYSNIITAQTTGGVSAPEMDILGTNLTSIANGEDAVSSTVGTEFPALAICDAGATNIFTITNTGSASLTLSGSPVVELSGDADFTVAQQPGGSVASGAAETFAIAFDPAFSGTRTTLVSIANNDSDENPYTFALQGTGTAPAAPGSITASDGGCMTNALTWSQNAAGHDVLVVFNTADSFSDPSDSTAYTAGDALGDATVLYNGSGTAFNHTNLTPGVTYYYKAWSVDDCDNYSASGVTDNRLIPCDCLAAPVSSAAGGISADQFNANWNSVDGATGYVIDVATNDAFSGGSSGTLISENFNSAPTPPSGWTFSGVGSYSSEPYVGDAANSIKLDDNGDSIETPAFSNPTGVTFWTRGNGSSCSMVVSQYNGSTWSKLADITPVDATDETHVYALSSSITKLAFVHNGPVGNDNICFDDVVINGQSSAGDFVDGYLARAVGDVTQLTVTGLNVGVTYYYRVRATNDYCESGNSATQNVTTTSGADSTPPSVSNLRVNDAVSIYDNTLGSVAMTVTLQDIGSGLDNNTAPSYTIRYPDGTTTESGNFTADFTDGTTASTTITNNGSLNTANWILGTYTVDVSAVDQSNNTASVSHTFEVQDDDPNPPSFFEFTIDGSGATGGTNLDSGALAVIGYNIDPTDEPGPEEKFAIVVLQAFDAGTVIDFTDNGWITNATPDQYGEFRSSESHFTAWTATVDYAVGQTFTLSLTNLNNGGDQIVAFQTSPGATNFIYALYGGNSTNWDDTATSAETSAPYPTLSNGITATAIPFINATYTGSLQGTASDLLRSISDPRNWYDEGSSTNLTWSFPSFNVTGSGEMQWDDIVLTDAQVHDGGYAITNRLQDTGSGLATNPAPYFVLYNTNSLMMVSNNFSATWSPGDMSIQTLAMTAPTGFFDLITIGAMTAGIYAADADDDRVNDGLHAPLDVTVYVTDDDTNGPSISNTKVSGDVGSLSDEGTLISYTFGADVAADLQPAAISEWLAVSNISVGGSSEPYSLETYTGNPDENAISEGGGWAAGDKYWTLAINIQSGFKLTLTNILFDERTTSTGPDTWTLRSSEDNYTVDLASGTLQQDSSFHSVSAAVDLTNLTDSVTLHLVGSVVGAASGGGTWRLDNLILQGTVDPGENAFFVSDENMANDGISISADVQDTGNGVYDLAGDNAPTYSIVSPSNVTIVNDTVFDVGPASDGDAQGVAVGMTGTTTVASGHIVLGVHTVSVRVVDYDNDRPNDGMETVVDYTMTVLDDDEVLPQMSTASGSGYLRFENKTAGSEINAVTDADLVDGLSFSNRVYDRHSGLKGGRSRFWISDPNGAVVSDQAFNTAPSDGEGKTNTFSGGALLEALDVNVDLANRALGVWTARISIADADADRNYDSLTNTRDFAFYVVDDDEEGPRMTNVTINGSAAAIIATGFENEDGWSSHTGGDWIENAYDGDWVSSNAYATTLYGRGGYGRNMGFNDLNDMLMLPVVTNPGSLIVWTRLSGSGTAQMNLEHLNGGSWDNLGTRTISTTSYRPLTWHVDWEQTDVLLRLRMVQDNGRSIYFDDLTLTPRAAWTNNAAAVLSWNASSDAESGNSDIAQYRVVDFGGDIPTSTVSGAAATSATFSSNLNAAAEGILTGYVFAVDNDSDRGLSDRTRGLEVPCVMRLDHTAPDQVTGLTQNDGADDTSEVRLQWTQVSDGGGNNLSPWYTYRVYYTDQGTGPTTNDPYVDLDDQPALGTNTTDDVVISNFVWGTTYRFAVAGIDRAGNEGSLSVPVAHTFRGFFVTQGLVNVSADPEVSWTAHSDGTNILKAYDVIYTDASGFYEYLTNDWQWMATVTNSMIVDTGGAGRPSPGALDGSLRFYRASLEGLWVEERQPRVASKEIYVLANIRLEPGQNWVAIPGRPDTNTAEFIFGHDLPAGSSSLNSTRVQWYERSGRQYATNEIWLSSSGGWQWSYPGNGDADDMMIPMHEGFVIEIPENESSTSLITIGIVPTNTITQTLKANAHNLVSFNVPRRVHPAQMGLLEAGFRGGDPFVDWNNHDMLWKLDRERQALPGAGHIAYYDTWLQDWYFLNGSRVPTNYFAPDDGIVIYRPGATTDLTWTNKILYQAPTPRMSP